MNKDTKLIYNNYKSILENTDIANNMSSDTSTKFTTDHMARFMPVGQDDEEKKKNPFKELKQNLNDFFTSIKALANACQSDSCKSSDIGKLLELMDNPAAKRDLNNLKNNLQLADQNNGNNSKLSF